MATACPNCLALEQRVAKLEAALQRRDAEIERLRGLLEESQRSGKRQAAPFSKGQPQEHPRRPGRKAGARHGKHGHRLPPDHVDETYEAPLPDACPDCGGKIRETHIEPQYQEEIPCRPLVRQFNIHFGECRDCGEPIALARLSAYPTATRCLACQQRHEKKIGGPPLTAV